MAVGAARAWRVEAGFELIGAGRQRNWAAVAKVQFAGNYRTAESGTCCTGADMIEQGRSEPAV